VRARVKAALFRCPTLSCFKTAGICDIIGAHLHLDLFQGSPCPASAGLFIFLPVCGQTLAARKDHPAPRGARGGDEDLDGISAPISSLIGSPAPAFSRRPFLSPSPCQLEQRVGHPHATRVAPHRRRSPWQRRTNLWRRLTNPRTVTWDSKSLMRLKSCLIAVNTGCV
jgi:hypothetical protein